MHRSRDSKSVPPTVQEASGTGSVDIKISDQKQESLPNKPLEESKCHEMTKTDILRFLHAIQYPENMNEITSICNKYEIRDITEFTH